jgi:hypothetical protein
MRFLSPRAHSIIGFVVGILLLNAPYIFDFNDASGAATNLARIFGVIIILSELTMRGSFSGIGFISVKTHIVLDILMGAFLVISPWLLGFSDEGTNAWLPHFIIGGLLMDTGLMTKLPVDEKPSD